MGNCCQKCFGYRTRSHQPYRNVTLLMVGLDGAGKTTIAKRLNGDSSDNILPTVGFSSIVMYYRCYKVTIYDLGGAAQIRDIWKKYYDDVHGVVFVIDASNINRINEAKRCFEEVLSDDKISGKPILILGNKQDKDDALDEMDIIDNLNVEQIVNEHQCPTRVEICSGLTAIKSDVRVQSGYHWLMKMIIENYDILDERVKKDMLERSVQVEREKIEWRKRKMERELLENKNDGKSSDDEESRNKNHLTNGPNPFKPIGKLIGTALRPSKVGPELTNGTLPTNRSVQGDSNSDNTVENVKDTKRKNLDIGIYASKNLDIAFTIDQANENGPVNERKPKRMFDRYGGKLKLKRSNKTAPIVSRDHRQIGSRMTDNDVTSIFTVSGKSMDDRSSLITKKVIRIRPATAPPKISVGPIWTFNQPLEVIDLESVHNYDANRIESSA